MTDVSNDRKTSTLGWLADRGQLTIRNGFSCGDHSSDASGVPHLRPFNVTEDCRLSFAQVKYIPRRPGFEEYALRVGDVLYNNTNSEELVGKCAHWPNRDGVHVLSNHMTILRLSQESGIDPRFLNFYLFWLWQSGGARMLCRRHVNQASIGLERLREIQVPVLDPSEQLRVVDFLTTTKRAIEAQEELVGTAIALKTATMQKLFRRGVRSESLKETELGPLPESWDLISLGERCRVKSGGTPSRAVAEYWNGDIPWVKTTEINYKEITATEERITLKGLQGSSAKVFEKGTLLMAMYGQGVTRGRVAVLGIPAATNQACAAFFPDESLSARYLYAYFTHAYDHVRQLGHGANQQNLSLELIQGIRIPVPRDTAEQETVYLVVAGIQNRIEVAQSELATLRELFRTTLHREMTGALERTNPDAQEVAHA